MTQGVKLGTKTVVEVDDAFVKRHCNAGSALEKAASALLQQDTDTLEIQLHASAGPYSLQNTLTWLDEDALSEGITGIEVDANGVATVTMAMDHPYRDGDIVSLELGGAAGSVYNEKEFVVERISEYAIKLKSSSRKYFYASGAPPLDMSFGYRLEITDVMLPTSCNSPLPPDLLANAPGCDSSISKLL